MLVNNMQSLLVVEIGCIFMSRCLMNKKGKEFKIKVFYKLHFLVENKISFQVKKTISCTFLLTRFLTKTADMFKSV